MLNIDEYRVWDPEGREYIDMLAAYSCVPSFIIYYHFAMGLCQTPSP